MTSDRIEPPFITRRSIARPLHRVARLLDQLGWWITEQPDRRLKRDIAETERKQMADEANHE